MTTISRRTWLKTMVPAAAGLWAGGSRGAESEGWLGSSVARVPCRAITRGPGHHWFGYYDKLQFDPANRFVLSNEVDFEHRTPTADDRIGIGMIDLQEGDRWIPLGTSHAWGWQQGCMLQWVPGTDSTVIWNDRGPEGFVSHLLDVKTGSRRTLPRPVYALSPDGAWAITADFARIQNMRPGYGYQGVPDPVADERAPADSGIWRMDLSTGACTLLISLDQLASIPHQSKDLSEQWNYVNHLLVNTDGSRFTFLHRWRAPNLGDARQRATGRFTTRMFTANPDGSDLYLLDPSGHTSHFIWRDAATICAWTRPEGNPSAFYLLRDHARDVDTVGQGVMTHNGHNTYLPGTNNAWILNDTYPDNTRRQTPYLYHQPTNRRVNLGHFFLPPAYEGEWRCDTHPRSSRDGRLVTIDSPHGGAGRQVWLLDVAEILAGLG